MSLSAIELPALYEPIQVADAPAVLPATTVESSPTANLQITVVSNEAALDALAVQWDSLFERTGQPRQVFQTFGFVRLWTRHFLNNAGEKPAHASLAILTAHRAGKLVFTWPLVIRREFGLDVAIQLGDPVAQYSDALVDPDENAANLLTAALAALRSSVHVDFLRIRKVRADSPLAQILPLIGAVCFNAVEAPCITLAAAGSGFEDRQSGKAKKNRRRLRRRLEEQGQLEFVHMHGPGTAPLVRAAFAMKRDWLVRRALISPALADERAEAFFTDAAADATSATGCRVFAIKLDGRTIAAAIGFAAKNRMMLHLITQSEDVERFGAGVLNLEQILRTCEAEGFEALDLLPPKADYKEDWADDGIAVADYGLGFTAAGRVWSTTVDRFAKPRLKKAVERLPHDLRKKLSARALGR